MKINKFPILTRSLTVSRARLIAVVGVQIALAWAQTPANEGNTPATPAAPTEVNVATTVRGATITGGESSNLLALLDNNSETTASLVPDAGTGTSVTTITLADTTDVSRLSLAVGQQKGQLSVYAIDPAAGGTAANAAQSGRLVSAFTLDGSTSTVAANLGGTSVQTLVLVWQPATPGGALTVSNIGIFTPAPPAAAALRAAGAPVPTAPPAMTTNSPVPAYAAGSDAPPTAAGATPAPASPTSFSSTASPVPPQTRNISL